MPFITNKQELKDYFGLNANLIGELPIDVLTSVQPIHNWDVTEYPVEEGFDITDARIKKPIGLVLDCIFTDPDFSARSAGKAALNGTWNTDSWQDKRDKLYEYSDSEEVIDVLVDGTQYESMVITNIDPNRVASTSNAYFVKIELKFIRVAASKISDVDESQIPKKKKAKKKQKHTEQDKRTAPEANEGGTQGYQNQSLASKATEWLAGVFGG